MSVFSKKQVEEEMDETKMEPRTLTTEEVFALMEKLGWERRTIDLFRKNGLPKTPPGLRMGKYLVTVKD